MQFHQKHAFWYITRQNWSCGLTPRCAKEQTKKAHTINISPLRGGHAPQPINMPFGLWSGVPNVITHAKSYVNRLRGFSATAPQKWPFPILFWTTLTTVLHCRADCDINAKFTVQYADECRYVNLCARSESTCSASTDIKFGVHASE